MPSGTVKFFNHDRGFGFISPEDGSKDSFVHISAVNASGLDALEEGQKVKYELEQGRNDKMAAVNIELDD